MYKDESFKALTVNLLGSPEGKAWLAEFKHHPEVGYYKASTKQGSGTEYGTAFYDGVKHPLRLVDLILTQAKTK